MPQSSPLGVFLRARRQQCRPQDFGYAVAGRRRTPGLRREEVAQLCGISPTWLAWIEQGRTQSVSVATLMALARGLKLTRAEREYLFGLAARQDPLPPRAEARSRLRLQALTDVIHAPAYVIDRNWDAVAWNAAAARLFPAWLGRAAQQRNLLHYVFLDAAARRQVVDWKTRSQRLVAEFRADTAALQDDPVRQAFVDELSALSAEFAVAWQQQVVAGREGGERRFRRAGRIVSYEQMTLRVALHPELKLVLLITAKS